MFLADAATTREGLAHVLGLGVSILGRAEFPARAGVTAIALAVFDREDESQELELVAELRSDTQPDEVVFRADGVLGYDGSVDGDLGAVTPIILDMSVVELPVAGIYRMSVRIGDETSEVEFKAIKSAD